MKTVFKIGTPFSLKMGASVERYEFADGYPVAYPPEVGDYVNVRTEFGAIYGEVVGRCIDYENGERVFAVERR